MPSPPTDYDSWWCILLCGRPANPVRGRGRPCPEGDDLIRQGTVVALQQRYGLCRRRRHCRGGLSNAAPAFGSKRWLVAFLGISHLHKKDKKHEARQIDVADFIEPKSGDGDW